MWSSASSTRSRRGGAGSAIDDLLVIPLVEDGGRGGHRQLEDDLAAGAAARLDQQPAAEQAYALADVDEAEAAAVLRREHQVGIEARAVVGDRRLLLADEPTGALDSVNGEGVMRLVRAACKRGVAGVVVTHDAQLASWADRVVFLRDGRVVDQTTTARGPESLLAPAPGA